jgi:branched-chain amino acid aminotransferase
VFDLRLNSHSRLNLIQALIQAINAGADEALMLDPRGFVASCNSTNFFIVRRGELWTSTGLYSFKGITQQKVIDVWRTQGRVARECDFTLAQVYSAEEAFVTGTLGGVTPVTRIDGRVIGDGKPGPLTAQASGFYLQSVLASSSAADQP